MTKPDAPHYVIVGNGVAGINATGVIRRRDDSAEITIISSESDHFFARTALMYVQCGQMSEEDIRPFGSDHYEQMRFNRVRGRVTTLNADDQSLKLEDGRNVDYDSLLIASGSVPRMADWPGQDLDGVGNFVTWQNLEWMREKAAISERAVIVGGGLIGVEVAEVLLKAGLEVTMVIREDWYWPIALDRREGEMIQQHMERHGCKLLLKTECQEVVGSGGKVVGLKTNHGDVIDCDMVVFTIGVVPQTNWLRDSGLELGNSGGIVVDDQLKTNLPDIWAAGDCASVVWFNGVRRPEQLWYTSRDQGLIAGANMCGSEKVYRRGILYNSAKFFDVEYTTAGLVNFNLDGEQNWYHREPGTCYSMRITYLPDNRVVGFNMLGRRWDHRVLTCWVDEKRSLGWVLRHLGEALFDEEFMTTFELPASEQVS